MSTTRLAYALLSLWFAAGTFSMAFAQQSEWIYDIFVNECVKAGGQPASTREQFVRGEKFLCNQNGSGRSGPQPPSGCERDAKVNIDWVFRDRGAQAIYARNRREGMSTFDAVIAAQAHNPRAQSSLRACQSWAENYLLGKDISPAGGRSDRRNVSPPDETMSSRRLAASDCSCISVVPAAGGPRRFQVTNDCDLMNVSVLFGGDILQFSPRADAISTWAYAGRLTLGRLSTIKAPEHWTIVTIEAVQLKNAASSFTCRMD